MTLSGLPKCFFKNVHPIWFSRFASENLLVQLSALVAPMVLYEKSKFVWLHILKTQLIIFQKIFNERSYY